MPTILITGANRGIGRGLFMHYIARPNTIAIAAVRQPSHPTVQSLHSLPRGANSKIIVVKNDSLSETDATGFAAQLKAQHNVDTLDLVIAVAGISKYYGSALDTPIKEMHDHFSANTFGPLLLFQATWPLLFPTASPKFVVISTIFGSIGDLDKYRFPAMAYGASKAAVNYIVRKIHFEHPGLCAFVINPGWVRTEMGNHGAKSLGFDEAPLSLEESVGGLVGKIDNATREDTSGTFQSYDGMEIAW